MATVTDRVDAIRARLGTRPDLERMLTARGDLAFLLKELGRPSSRPTTVAMVETVCGREVQTLREENARLTARLAELEVRVAALVGAGRRGTHQRAQL